MFTLTFLAFVCLRVCVDVLLHAQAYNMKHVLYWLHVD